MLKMAMSVTPTPVLWLDDELGTGRELRLSPWLVPLRALERAGQIRLTACNTIADFANQLGCRLPAEQWATLPRHGLLILDVMLTEDEAKNFESLGFHEEGLFPLDAGAQVAGLLRSSMYDDSRSPWLNAYRDVPLLLLSSSPTLQTMVTKQVGSKRMRQIELITKRIEHDARRGRVVADPEFDLAIRRLLGSQV